MISAEGHLGCAVIGDMVVGMSANLGAVGMVTDGAVGVLIALYSTQCPTTSETALARHLRPFSGGAHRSQSYTPGASRPTPRRGGRP